MGEEQQREGGERQDNKKVEEVVGEEAVVEKLEKEEDVEEKVEKRGRFNVGNIKVDKVGNKVAGESDTDNTKKEVLAENIESVEPVKKAVEVDEKLERKEAEEEPEQNEEEEPCNGFKRSGYLQPMPVQKYKSPRIEVRNAIKSNQLLSL